MLPPITVTKDGNGVVTQATVKLVPNIWTQLIETTDPYMVPPVCHYVFPHQLLWVFVLASKGVELVTELLF
jgi:hypothetical protein